MPIKNTFRVPQEKEIVEKESPKRNKRKIPRSGTKRKPKKRGYFDDLNSLLVYQF